jgi:hypothetical protein
MCHFRLGGFRPYRTPYLDGENFSTGGKVPHVKDEASGCADGEADLVAISSWPCPVFYPENYYLPGGKASGLVAGQGHPPVAGPKSSFQSFRLFVAQASHSSGRSSRGPRPEREAAAP